MTWDGNHQLRTGLDNTEEQYHLPSYYLHLVPSTLNTKRCHTEAVSMQDDKGV